MKWMTQPSQIKSVLFKANLFVQYSRFTFIEVDSRLIFVDFGVEVALILRTTDVAAVFLLEVVGVFRFRLNLVLGLLTRALEVVARRPKNSSSSLLSSTGVARRGRALALLVPFENAGGSINQGGRVQPAGRSPPNGS